MHAKKYEGFFAVIVVWTGRALRNLINASGSKVFSCQFDFWFWDHIKNFEHLVFPYWYFSKLTTPRQYIMTCDSWSIEAISPIQQWVQGDWSAASMSFWKHPVPEERWYYSLLNSHRKSFFPSWIHICWFNPRHQCCNCASIQQKFSGTHHH